MGSEGPQETQGLSMVVARETWHPLHAEWPELPGERAAADGPWPPLGTHQDRASSHHWALAANP